MLTEIHIFLTYKCTYECDHCFLYSNPEADGTITIQQIRNVLEESQKIGSVKWIYFEGGEPFLFYPLLVEGVKLARNMGFQVGIVTNAYWATSQKVAELKLRPLQELGLDFLSISDDIFHNRGRTDNFAKRALTVALKLGIPSSPICIQKPFVEALPGQGLEKGAPVVGGGAMFKGRAVDKLTEGLPQRPWDKLLQCPHEDLQSPSRVHLDSHGNIHLCQGVSMGNLWQRPLSELVAEYKAGEHPICAPLTMGGPAALARQYEVDHEEEYIDECHFCYLTRRALIDRFPTYLAPRQVYGLDQKNDLQQIDTHNDSRI